MAKKKVQPLTFQSLTPDHICDIAYAYYVCTLSKEDAGVMSELAKSIRAEFKRLQKYSQQFDINSEERDFMSRVSSVVLSLSRGILRGKDTYSEELQAAQEEKKERMDEMSAGTRKKILTRGLARALLVGGIGFTLVRAIFPSLNVAASTDPTYFSFALGLALILVSTIVQDTLVKNKVGRIFASYELEKSHAYTRYRSELRVEYLRAKAGAHQAWVDLFDSEPLDLPSFEMILDEEARLNGIFEQRRVELSLGSLRRFFRELGPVKVISSAIKRAKSGEEKKQGEQT